MKELNKFPLMNIHPRIVILYLKTLFSVTILMVFETVHNVITL